MTERTPDSLPPQIPSGDTPRPSGENDLIRIGINNETDTLKAAMIWGSTGPESHIAQLYPYSQSLFLATMDVQKAKAEAERFGISLEQRGVQILRARHLYAKGVEPTKKYDQDVVFDELKTRAREITQTHKAELEDEIRKAKEANDPNGRQELYPSTFESDLENLLEADIRQYGIDAALQMAHELTLIPDMPMGNLIYARDQMNVLLGTRVRSNMAKPIRVPEVPLYEALYQRHLSIPESFTTPNGETFEGGDAYIHNGYVYVGVGTRTTLGAAEAIYRHLKPQMDEKDLKFAIVVDTRPPSTDPAVSMESMHLDTYSNPIGHEAIAVCTNEASYREVFELGLNKDDSIRQTSKGAFMEHLTRLGEDIIAIPKEEQMDFACNFLMLDDRTVILPNDKNEFLINGLTQRGKEIVVIDLFENTRGYGASHCMTGQLRRE